MAEDCPICGEELSSKYTYELDCKHKFHYECLLKSLKFSDKNQCPTCRGPFKYLEPVNGLKNLSYRIHYDINNKSIVNDYINHKCDHIITKGKNKDTRCNKNCKLGYYKCNLHIKKLEKTVKNINKKNN